jgi:hypothetical protein
MLDRKAKNIIYVDASSKLSKYRIGLWDKTNKIRHTVALGDSVKKISDAEMYAVLYGLIYIQKSNNPNRHILMNDCESAVKNPKLLDLGDMLNTKIMWIPREINKADKVAKMRVNKKAKVWHNLDFCMKILFGDMLSIEPCVSKPTIPIVNKVAEKVEVILSLMSQETLNLILENKKLFPMSKVNFGVFIQKVYKKENIPLKKGNVQNIREELLKNKVLLKKGNNLSIVGNKN